MIDLEPSPRSLYSRAGRYPRTVAIDPRENRLTEAFASALERLPTLTRSLVAHYLLAEPSIGSGPDDLWSVRVSTQVATTSGGFVDLAIHLVPQADTTGEPTVPGDVMVWVEIKHGAGLSGNQLEAYCADIQGQGAATRVILLTPRGFDPGVPVPADVRRVMWQEVASFIRGWRQQQRKVLTSRAAFLVDELLHFLSEEGLMDEDRLTAAHAFALSVEPSSHATVAQVCSIAAAALRQTHGEPTDYYRGPGGRTEVFGVGFWSNRKTLTSGEGGERWRSCWLEWGLRADGGREEPRQAIAFVAGLTIEASRNNPLTVAGNQDWRAGLEAKGFEYVSDWYWRFWRYLYPEQLLALPPLETQGRALAVWVGETFDLLLASPPPA